MYRFNTPSNFRTLAIFPAHRVQFGTNWNDLAPYSPLFSFDCLYLSAWDRFYYTHLKTSRANFETYYSARIHRAKEEERRIEALPQLLPSMSRVWDSRQEWRRTFPTLPARIWSSGQKWKQPLSRVVGVRRRHTQLSPLWGTFVLSCTPHICASVSNFSLSLKHLIMYGRGPREGFQIQFY